VQETKRFASDVGLILIASIINMLLTLVISIVLGRNLGAEDLGLYKMTYTFYGIAILTGALGIPSAVIKFVAELKDDRQKLDQLVSSAVITSFTMGILFSIAFFLLSDMIAGAFNMPMLGDLLRTLSPIFPFVLTGSALFGLLNGLRKIKIYAFISILQSGILIAVTLILIYRGLGVEGAIIGMVASSFTACFVLVGVCRKFYGLTLIGYSKNARILLDFGIKMFGANLVNTLNSQADTLFIGYFLPASSVGYYGAAANLSRFFWLFPQAIQTISYPATSEYYSKRDMASLQKMIDKSMRFSAVILLPIGLVLGVFAEEIVVLIYGQDFSSSKLPLQILIVGTLIFGITCTSIGGTLAGVNRPDLSLKASAVGAIVNALLNLSLIPTLGLVGASIAMTASLLISAMIFDIMVIRTLRIRLHLAWLAKAVFLMGLAIIFFEIGKDLLNHYFIGLIILGIYISLTCGIILTKEDMTFIKRLVTNPF
jgi:stage V sporulation protein B